MIYALITPSFMINTYEIGKNAFFSRENRYFDQLELENERCKSEKRNGLLDIFRYR